MQSFDRNRIGGSRPDIATMKVPVSSVRPTVQALLDAGISEREIWGDGEQLPLTDQDQAFCPGNVSLRLLETALRYGVLGPGGVPRSTPFEISDYGMVGYAMLSSATLGQAIDLAMRYYRTAGPMMALSSADTDGLVVIRCHNVYSVSPPVWRYLVENLFAGFPPLLNLLLGYRAPATSVSFDYPCPTMPAVYEATFGCPVAFASDECAFWVPTRLLQEPLARADAAMANLLERSCQELLASIEDPGTLTARVTQALLAEAGELPSAPDMAKRLGIGVRTLRRRLADEETSFQTILDEVRRRMACDYLTTTDLSIQQVAELLGYTEATNFRRAFRKWTALSPAAYRSRNRNGTSQPAAACTTTDRATS